MRVVQVFRKAKKGNHSIERVFSSISENINENFNCKIFKVEFNGSLPKLLKDVYKIEPDVIHITGDVHYLSLLFPRKKTILTIHDLGYFKNYKLSVKKIIYLIIWFIIPVRYTNNITVVSKQTKIDLIRYTLINSKKISLIPNPLVQKLNKLHKSNNNYFNILQIGTGFHKNLRNLVKAVIGMKIKLIIVGNPEKELINLMETNCINHEIHFNVSDKKLNQLYCCSDLLFFASLSEGFGLPILEAQSLGIPVITSNFNPMRDVAGAGACLVDPKSVTEIRNTIETIINNKKIKEKIINSGFENYTKYSIDLISRMYFDKYYETSS